LKRVQKVTADYKKTTTDFETVEFTTADGLTLNLKHVINSQPGAIPPSKGPVLLVHGAGVRANIFSPPVQTTFVEFLCAHGYDVWLENWRASIDMPPNLWTLDQAAVFDHPAAVKKVIERTGAKSIKAVIHCQGSTSFMMSAVAGLVPQVDTIISNAVSLHPVVPWASALKINLASWPIQMLTPYLNPQWGKAPPTLLAKLIRSLVHFFHRECNNTVCRHASFTYGTGFPTLWRHENLNTETHDWLSNEFGFLPTRFYTQIGRSIRKGHLLSVEHFASLPLDFVESAPKTQARFAFFAGLENVCFTAESQQKTFAHFDKQRPNFHSLTLVEGYGHLCMFLGKNAANDVFPLMLKELDKTV
jgi:pimeloyl-ACP methyl ester carboxylesterase